MAGSPANISSIGNNSVDSDNYSNSEGYADGTSYVQQYNSGTSSVDDPWSWAEDDKNKIVAPLTATIRPANEPMMPNAPDKGEQQLAGLAMGKTIPAIEAGYTAGKTAYAAPLSAPITLTTGAAPGITAANMGSTGLIATGGTSGLAGGALAAPGAATLAEMGGAGLATTAAGTAATGAATGAATAGLTGAAAAGSEAALAALGPIGIGIGALLLAKKLKIF
jgi:hypothetical protein